MQCASGLFHHFCGGNGIHHVLIGFFGVLAALSLLSSSGGRSISHVSVDCPNACAKFPLYINLYPQITPSPGAIGTRQKADME